MPSATQRGSKVEVSLDAGSVDERAIDHSGGRSKFLLDGIIGPFGAKKFICQTNSCNFLHSALAGIVAKEDRINVRRDS
jgi:hypothetical protein